MKLIDRYLNEVGRYLTGKNRKDILAEIKSHLSDTLEERVRGEASEEDVAALLKEFGSPQKIASSYSEGQNYLIGPELYPFFRFVAGIVFAAVVGAQLLAFGVSIWAGEESLNLYEALGSLLMSIPSALGFLVITFMILQRYGVKPDLEEGEWDPNSLPEIEDEEEIKRGELIFGISAGSLVLAVIAAIPERIGFYGIPGWEFYPDPVLSQNIGLICLSLLASIGLDIYLLWQGRWTMISRVARVAVNVISIVVLAILAQGHTVWLQAQGSEGFFLSLEHFESDLASNIQLVGMESLRLAFGVAFIVTVIETIVLIVKGIYKKVKSESIPDFTIDKP